MTGPVDAFGFPVVARRQDAFAREQRRNLLYAHAVEREHIDAAHDRSGFFVHDPALGAVRVFGVAIRRRPHRLTCVSTDFVTDSPLFAYIPAVPLVKKVANRSKLVFSLVCVYSVGDRHKAYVVLGEKFLRQASNLDIVAPETAEVFDEHRRCFAEFELGYHVFIARPVHCNAGDTVVEKVNEVCIALFLGNLGQQLLLVLYAVAVAFKIIVTRETLVKKSRSLAGFTVCLSHTFLLFAANGKWHY